ncbi:hypothetical protein ACVWYQ_006399 [Bradyrhizobium sp. USDA 3397]
MSNPVQALLQAGVVNTTLFATTSRYYGLGTATFETAGATVVYLRRRFVPSADRFALLQEHTVVQEERLDAVATRYYGDPEQFWRLCDANGAMRPAELVEEPGRRIRITLPEGIPAPSDGASR